MDGGSRRDGIKVQLGCGTLLVIALIVLLFSGAGEIDDLEDEVRLLRQQVERLEAKIDALAASGSRR